MKARKKYFNILFDLQKFSSVHETDQFTYTDSFLKEWVNHSVTDLNLQIDFKKQMCYFAIIGILGRRKNTISLYNNI